MISDLALSCSLSPPQTASTEASFIRLCTELFTLSAADCGYSGLLHTALYWTVHHASRKLLVRRPPTYGPVLNNLSSQRPSAGIAASFIGSLLTCSSFYRRCDLLHRSLATRACCDLLHRSRTNLILIWIVFFLESKIFPFLHYNSNLEKKNWLLCYLYCTLNLAFFYKKLLLF